MPELTIDLQAIASHRRNSLPDPSMQVNAAHLFRQCIKQVAILIDLNGEAMVNPLAELFVMMSYGLLLPSVDEQSTILWQALYEEAWKTFSTKDGGLGFFPGLLSAIANGQYGEGLAQLAMVAKTYGIQQEAFEAAVFAQDFDLKEDAYNA